MKKLGLLFAMFLVSGFISAQTVEKKEAKTSSTKQELPQEAGKGAEISEMATTIEPGKTKGVSISSPARRSTLMKANPAKRAEAAEKRGEASKNANSLKPAQAGRPANIIPAARPTPPVVRPNAPATPATPGRPVIPPTGKPGGI